jgi:hypothetical protein
MRVSLRTVHIPSRTLAPHSSVRFGVYQNWQCVQARRCVSKRQSLLMDTNNKRFNTQVLGFILPSLLTVLTVISLFFGEPARATPPPASTNAAVANFIGLDMATQGAWEGKYGTDGYVIANGPQSVPGYASFAPQSQLNWIWAASTSDARALVSGSGRTATTFYSTSFSMDINITDGNQHQIAIYAVDWDQRGRSETFQVLDASSGVLLDSRNISTFSNGIYAIWNVSGHVRVNVILTAGCNAVVSGIFFGSSSAQVAATTARFLNSNSTSQGKWQSNYGADGFSIAGGNQKMPSYATLASQNEQNWTYAANTTDPRALQAINGPATAATWYNYPSLNLDVNMTDGQSHQMALYALDWDTRGRTETIQIVDANTGSTLNSQTVTNFSNGIYLVWAITGHVKVNVTISSGPNAVLSGVFFGPVLNANVPIPATAPAITTQPASQTVTAGQSAAFTVANTGTAPMTYQWQKNGVGIAGATSSSYTTPATANSDNGSQFMVAVSNGSGSVSSSAATLTVKAGTLILNASATSLNFASVNVSSSSMQSVTFTNAGTANVTIANVSISGAGFNASGLPAGTILPPGQTATLNATFAPGAAGSVNGSISLSSNTSNGVNVVTLSGTGMAVPVAHNVSVEWVGSTSTVVGYNVYISTVSGGSFTKLTSSPVPTTNYTDAGLQTAQTRYYVVTSVNASNQESAYSNEVSALVP